MSLRLPRPLLLTAALLLSPVMSTASPAPAAYTVAAGDTLYQVAHTHGTDPGTLLRLNNLSSSTLNVGQVLRLPVNTAAAAPAPAPRPTTGMPPRPPGLPRVTPGPVRGPLAWSAPPQPTVASFIGYLPVVATAAFGDLLPIRTYIGGLAFSYQTYNNCGPSALSSVLGFYKADVGQDAIRRATRKDGGYMQTSAIAPELARFGLRTVTIRQGRLAQVKRLLSMGIPVIVLQWYDRPGHINHFRVVRGYDDQAGVVWVSDSMIGPVAYLSYEHFEALWNTQDRQMFPVYPNGFDARVRALL